jgi:hypothetical protein
MTDEKKKKKKAKKPAGPKRIERRFVPVASTNPWIVRVLGALGGLTIGAGAYAYLYATGEGHAFHASDVGDRMGQIPSWLIAGGAVLMGATIWLGTSSESPVRIGDPGIAVEKGEVRRMPWWGIERITWQPGERALLVTGKDETHRAWTFKVPVASHPEAVARIVEESRHRIKKKVDIERGVLKQMPVAHEHAGQRLELEPLQVVGKKCAASGKLISYEPDARVCPLCERVYFKRSVPNKCKCGNDISGLRPATIAEPEDVNDDFYDSQEEEEEERDDEDLGDDEVAEKSDADAEADRDDDDDDESEKRSSKKVKAAEDAET